MAEEYTPTTAQVRQLYANSMDPTGFDRWLAAHDAELRAEVERLREVSAAQPYETERELAVALDEARQQVADLRAGIRDVPSTPGDVQGLKGRQAATYRAGWEAAGREYRALLAGQAEQPGEVDGYCTCHDDQKGRTRDCGVKDHREAGRPAPVSSDSADVRERVRDVFVNAERRESFGGTDIDSLTDAVLAVVGQGVTAEQREQAVGCGATWDVRERASEYAGLHRCALPAGHGGPHVEGTHGWRWSRAAVRSGEQGGEA